MTDVLIVGAGPTGLVLACDLARRGVAVRIVDRSPAPARTSRAKGPNPRSLEILDDLGVAEEVLAAGSAPLPMLKYRDRRPVAEADPWADSAPSSSPDARYDRGWLIAQWRLEGILRDRLAGYGVRVEPGREVVGLAQGRGEGEGADGGHVDVTYADGPAGRARYVVGCDGAHSSVRKLLGVTFEGTTAEDQVMVCGDVDLAEGVLDRTRWHQWFDEDGAVMLCPIPGTRTGWWFQAGPERDGRGRPLAPTAEGFRRLLAHHTALPGRDLTRAELLSTYRVNVRMADRFRAGRVLLAGDAAHVHAIAGGLGMNTGIQDAFNLGWKLGLVLAGHADAELLDTYEEERLPVAARTLDLASERLRATLEAIHAARRRPGSGDHSRHHRAGRRLPLELPGRRGPGAGGRDARPARRGPRPGRPLRRRRDRGGDPAAPRLHAALAPRSSVSAPRARRPCARRRTRTAATAACGSAGCTRRTRTGPGRSRERWWTTRATRPPRTERGPPVIRARAPSWSSGPTTTWAFSPRRTTPAPYGSICTGFTERAGPRNGPPAWWTPCGKG